MPRKLPKASVQQILGRPAGALVTMRKVLRDGTVITEGEFDRAKPGLQYNRAPERISKPNVIRCPLCGIVYRRRDFWDHLDEHTPRGIIKKRKRANSVGPRKRSKGYFWFANPPAAIAFKTSASALVCNSSAPQE